MPEFDALPCWEIPVNKTISSDVGSLSDEEHPIFFATHVELPIDQLKGGRGLQESGDVLRAFQTYLESDITENTVFAVTGPSGSGKSHLVRWIQAKLSLAKGDLLVYVPREVTTLRETLELVCRQIGGEAANQLLDQLKAAVGSVSEEQLSGQLLDAICQVLEHEPSTAGISNANLILPKVDNSRVGLPSIMRIPRVRTHLLREDLTVRDLARSILGSNKGGDQERPQFLEDDLDFLNLDGLDAALDSPSKHPLRILANKPEARTDAAELINRTIDAAVQRTLGWRDGGVSLQTVLGDVRKRLAGQQIVLLFEDLALVNFVEGAILDEFRNHGNKTKAPLRVMFAVTDDKYTAIIETIEASVTSQFRVEALPLDEEDAGELALREEFIARQLNLARVGRSKVLEEAKANRPLPVKCRECRSKDECFSGFGFVPVDVGGQTENVGLFPYNRVALSRAFRLLEAERKSDNKKVTPRASIDRIILDGLEGAHIALTNKTMPNYAIASIVDDGSFAQTRDDILAGATGIDESTQDRIYRTRVFWMDEGIETQEVAKAFGLPEIGDVDRPPEKFVPPVQPIQPPAADLAPAYLQDVLRWANNGDDAESLNAKADEKVRTILEKLVADRVDLRPYLVAQGEDEAKRLLRILLGRNSFSLGGTGRPQENRIRFDLPRNSTTYRLVVGAAWLDANKDWDFESEKVSWALPKLSDKWRLAVEVESFLSNCAARIEDAVLDLIVEGSDPASVAYRLRERAAAALVDDPPVVWRTVVRAAERVCVDQSIKSAVLSFSGAVGPSSNAGVAALDVALFGKQGKIEDGVTQLAESFPKLVQGNNELDSAANAALPELVNQTKRAEMLIANNVGDASLKEVANSIVAAGQAANQAGFFQPGDRYIAFVDACTRLADGRVPSLKISDRLSEFSFDPDVIRDAAHLIAVARDVDILVECCEATERAGRTRVNAEAGGVSVESEGNELAKAGESFITALRELAEEAKI